MKAIITGVKKSSGFARLNGHTFIVAEVLSEFVAVYIPSQLVEGKFDTCDFTHEEVTIVDIDEEVQKAFDSYNWGSDLRTYSRLKMYCGNKKIETNEKYHAFN